MKMCLKSYIIFFSIIVFQIASLSALTEQEAFAVGTKAYTYGYPYVMTQMTKNFMTNICEVDVKNGKAPINQFLHASEFPDPQFTEIVRPNVDTLYSMAWIDLSKGPLILSVPDTHDRYYVLQLMDASTSVFASIGKRTNGTRAKNFVLVGPDWQGNLPEDMEEVQAPTNMVWIIGRTQTNGKSDYKKVRIIQKGYKLTSLDIWEKKGHRIAPLCKVDASIDMHTAPVDQVAAMNAETFFTTLSKALSLNPPPSKRDKQVLVELKKIGIGGDKKFNWHLLAEDEQKGLERAAAYVQKKLVENEAGGDMVNGWHIMRSDIGRYGTNYKQRAMVAYKGIGANLPLDALYPTAFVDSRGRQLNGQYNYRIHFDADEIPPVEAFWSITLYNDRSFLVANNLQRYALGDRDDIEFNEDGSLDIYIQHQPPCDDEKVSNWLPSPKGDFNLTMRLYWPDESVIDGSWEPPTIGRLK
jgi:hypothetical protein